MGSRRLEPAVRRRGRPADAAAGGARLGAARGAERRRRGRGGRARSGAACWRPAARSRSRSGRARPRRRRRCSSELGFVEVRVTPDLAGIDRVVEGPTAVSDVDGDRRARSATGELAVLPTDTVYGLVCTAFERRAGRRSLPAQGPRARSSRPRSCSRASTSLLELSPSSTSACRRSFRALLPGPYTLVVPNPARPLRLALGGRPESIGVRVPGSPVSRPRSSGASVQSSRRARTSPASPTRVDSTEVPPAILAGVVAAIDGGELPGAPSTVIDLTGAEPRGPPRRRRRSASGSRARRPTRGSTRPAVEGADARCSSIVGAWSTPHIPSPNCAPRALPRSIPTSRRSSATSSSGSATRSS